MTQKSGFLCIADHIVSNQYPIMKGYYTKHLFNEKSGEDKQETDPKLCSYCGLVFGPGNSKFRIIPRKKNKKTLNGTPLIHITCTNCFNSSFIPCLRPKNIKPKNISIQTPSVSTPLKKLTSQQLLHQLNTTPSAASTPLDFQAPLNLSKSAKKKARMNSFRLSHQTKQANSSTEPSSSLMLFLTSL